MGEGIIGIIGTVVGGLLGVAGTIAAARLTGRDQRRNQRQQWHRQVRRDAYSAFLIQITQAYRVGYAAYRAVGEGASDALERMEELDARVGRVDEAVTIVMLEGPERAATAAATLWSRLAAWRRELGFAHSGTDDDRSRALDAAEAACEDIESGIDGFASLGQRLLNEEEEE